MTMYDRTVNLDTGMSESRGQLYLPAELIDVSKTRLGHEKPRMPRTRRTSLVNRRESRTGKRSSNASSDGSCVQPSIGMPFAKTKAMVNRKLNSL
jgi:hypothetical protein